MANVTDCVFRGLFAKYGKPDVTWTEFVSADGLVSAGGKRLLIDLKYSPKERPIVAQLFTGHPDKMFEAARLIRKLKFDGLDINMGCPDRAVEKQGGGSALIKSPRVAIEVLNAARRGWAYGSASALISENNLKDGMNVPVSVKTRLGYNQVDFGWIRLLLEQNLPALTVHLRTRKEMSDVPAHWEVMPEIVKMRDEIQNDRPVSERTLIIGNGDVGSLEEAVEKTVKYGCDGVMIGRGIFGKPWFFEEIGQIRKMRHLKSHIGHVVRPNQYILKDILNQTDDRTPRERLKIMLEHARLFDKEFCGRKRVKNFAVMKKHFKAYVSGWDGTKELRAELMETENYREVKKIVENYIRNRVD
ncbi:MAG: tRNA-dihydrouridine synthase [Patescibacteria group bacterium]|nr:tRNA-dihydrouridine synthase [Patescibacteria group bacterium]